MKPAVAIVDINVVGFDRNHSCSAQRAVSPCIRKLPLRAVSLCLLCLSATHVAQAQTSIVGFRTSKTIVIGSDGIARQLATGKTKRFCKIQQFGDTFFSAASSYSENPATGFSLWEIAGAACSQGGTVEEKMERFVATVQPPLKIELEAIRNGSLEDYRKTFAKNEKVVLQAMMAGFENGVPVLLTRDFILSNPDTSPVSFAIESKGCLGDCELGQTYIYTLGFKDHMQPLIKTRAARGIKESLLPQIARSMIAAEVGKHPEVGPPITVLRITKAGAEWIGDKGECNPIKK